MKKKALLASILTIAMCFSIIAGATYALFTSESGVDVAITAGNVDVVATINEGSLKTYSLDVEQKPGYFANRGTATLTSTLLTLTNVTPGDRADFTIDMTNNSNVDIQYRVKWAVDGELYSMLDATADGNPIVNNVSAWSEWLYDAEDVRSIDVSVELPYTVGNEGENQTAEIQFFVEAVQGNAILEEVATEDQLRVALEMGAENITLMNDIAVPAGLTIENDVAIELNGFTMTSSENRAYLFTISGDANVTINGGKLVAESTNGVADGTGASTGASTLIYSNTTGKVTVNNVQMQGSARGGHRAVDIYNGEAELNNVTIDVNYGAGVVAGNNANVVLNNCAITSTGIYDAVYNSVCFGVWGNGSMTVNGGKYVKNADQYYNTGATHGGWVGIVMNSGGTIVISDGSFENNATTGFVPNNERAMFQVEAEAGKTSSLYLLGGTYKPQEDQIVGGYGYGTRIIESNLTNNGDGTWTAGKIAGKYFITNADELIALSEKSFKNEEIVLLADVDLGGAEFKSMIAARSGALTFKGNGHTVSGVNFVSGNGDNTTGQAAMFYCFPGSTLDVSNLTIANSTVTATPKSNGYAAAVIGYCEGNATLTNVDVENVDVIGSKSSGSLVGHLSAGANLVATDCNVTGSTVTLTDKEEVNGHYAGKAIGTIAANATLTNCSFDATVSGHLHANNVGDLYGRYIGGALIVDGTV